MSLKWIKNAKTFSEIDPEAASYFEELQEDQETISLYSFNSLPEFKSLLNSRLDGIFTSEEILEISRQTFRSKPQNNLQPPKNEDHKPADFIYQI